MNISPVINEGKLNFKHLILLIFLAILGGFLLLPVFHNHSLAINSDDYLKVAERWKQSGIFPDTFYGPIYIIYVSLFPRIDATVPLILCSQIVLSAATVCFVYQIALHCLKNSNTAMLAAAFWLISPLRIIYSGLVFTETLYTFFAVLGILLFIKSRSLWGLSSSALILALAALTRGNGLVVGVIIFGYLIIKEGWKHARPYQFFTVFLIPILIVSWINFNKYRVFKPTPSGDYNIAILLVGRAKAEVMGVPDPGNPALWEYPGETFRNDFEEARVCKERALQFAAQHPYVVLRTNLKGWLSSMTGCGTAQWTLEWRTLGKVIASLGSLLRMAIYGIALAWTLVSLARSGRSSKGENFVLLLFLAFVFAHIIPAGAEGFSRYCFPVDPVAGIAAAMAIQHVSGRILRSSALIAE